jgi:tetratricopeptide (TPR) repeat protein
LSPKQNALLSAFQQRPDRVTLILLGLFTALVFLPVLGNDFVVFDDREYVYDNELVKRGVTLEGIRWAFTDSFQQGNWDPFNWLSHMLACELFGVAPAGHHFVNLALHVAITLLLFIALRRMKLPIVPCAIVAALFAIHPIHVEPVAWVAERKGLLSSLFWMLTLLAYLKFVNVRSRKNYAWIVVWFVLGLMSKPMLVTLPFTLLLLDFWPLNRMFNSPEADGKPMPSTSGPRPGAFGRLIPLAKEKWPLFLISFVWMPIAVLSQKAFGAVATLDPFPLGERIQNALVSYCVYLRKMVFPNDLAVHYPFPETFPLWQTLAAIALLGGLSVAAFMTARKRPYLFVGWFWFLGSMVPVIQIVQIWTHAMADRYAYIPSIGIFIVVVWGGAELFKKYQLKPAAQRALVAILLATCSVATIRQTAHWKDTISLFGHARTVTSGNALALSALGEEFYKRERIPEAVAEFEAALKARPKNAAANYYMATIRMRESREHISRRQLKAARQTLLAAINHDPKYLTARLYLGLVLMEIGEAQPATEAFASALQMDAGGDKTHLVYFSNGRLLAKHQHWAEASAYFRVALKLQPEFPEAHYELALAHIQLSQFELAIVHLQHARNGLDRPIPDRFKPENSFQPAALTQASESEPLVPFYSRPTRKRILESLQQTQAELKRNDPPSAAGNVEK